MISTERRPEITAIIDSGVDVMEGLALSERRGREERSQKNFENSVAYQEWVLRNELALYPEDHPATGYVRSLFGRLVAPTDSHDFRVTVYKGNPNAFCLPNGSIFISDRLIDLADVEEEILFAFGHEKSHVTQEHSRQSIESAENRSTRSIINQALSHFGRARFHEWEADLRAFNELERLGVNPMGGVDLLEKFRRLKRGGIDVGVHGEDTDRVLNLRMMTHMQDITTVQDPFHPVPAAVKTSIGGETNFISWYDFFLNNLKSRNIDNIGRALRNLNGATAILVLPDVMQKYKVQLGMESQGGRNWADYQRRVITTLGQQVWNHISGVFDRDPNARLSDQQKALLFHSLLEFTSDSETTNEENSEAFTHPTMTTLRYPNGRETQWNKRKISFQKQIYSDEDVDELLTILRPEIFTRLGIKLNSEPNNLIVNLTKRILDQEIYLDEDGNMDTTAYVDFAERFADAIADLYGTHGTIEVESTALFTSIIEVAKGVLPEAVFSKLEREAIAKLPEASKALRESELSEETPDAKLFKLFQRYLTEFKPLLYQNEARGIRSGMLASAVKEVSDEDRSTKQSPREEIDSRFQAEARQLLEGFNFENHQQVLAFLASFRNRLINDPNSWDVYESSNTIHNAWSSLVYNLIINRYLPTEALKTTDGLLFRMKVAMLLQSDTVVWFESPLAELCYEFESLMEDPNFSLADYERVYNLVKAGSLDDEFSMPVHTAELLSGVVRDNYWPEALRKGIYYLLDRSMSSSPSKEEFNTLFMKLTTEFPFDHYGSDLGIDEDSIEWGILHEGPLKNKVLEKIFRTYEFDLTNPQDLRTLYYLSTYFEDTSYAVRLQDIAWAKLAQRLPFNEGLKFLSQEIKGKRLLSLKAAQNYIEQAARSHQEIRQAKDVLVELLTSGVEGAEIGKLLAAEQFFDLFFQRTKPELLLACIGNGVNDETLKRYLYTRWVSAYNSIPQTTEGYINLNDLTQKLYSLDAQKKYILIRDLLTGENGVLTHRDPKYREQLVDFFIDNYVEATDDFEKGMQTVLRDVMKEMVRTANYDLIYFALAPLLQDRLLVTPPNRVSWREVIDDEVSPRSFDAETKLVGGGVIDEEDDYDMEEDSLDDMDFEPREARKTVERPTAESTDKIFQLINGMQQDESLKASDEARREYETVVQSIIGGYESNPERLKLSVTEFISEVAQTLGAPGVRFLQLIGQYVELPPHLEQAFRNVYDKVEGQSKITADNTLLREWPQAEHALDGLTVRLGGGSLMSVFQSQHNEGEQRAVKILNPNSAFHTETTYQLLAEVFSKLSTRDPRFAPALTVLDDIRDWIRGDIDFTGFLEADSRFRQKHDGYSVGGRYRIKVPVSYEPENKFFAQEEYIEGTNLTDLDSLSAQGHDLRQIMTLVTRDFFEQVKDGLVHSDIHPGNIRITPSNEVAYLDRNFYIPLSIPDRFFLAGLTQRLGDANGAVEHSLNYLRSQGAEIDDAKRARIIEQAASLNNIPDPTNRMLGLTVMLRKEDLRFPLKITLLVKDFFYLDRLSKRAGYSGLTEAMQA